MKPKTLKDCWRIDFRVLIDRCSCVEGAMKGKCKPKICYPDLHSFLYPFGGCPAKSHVSKLRKESLSVFKARRKMRKGGKKGEKGSKSTGVC